MTVGITRHELGAGELRREARRCRDGAASRRMLALALVLEGTWSKTPGKLWKVGETAEGRARENPAFPPFLRLAAASIRRCCTCVPGVFDQMRGRGPPSAHRPRRGARCRRAGRQRRAGER